jgi:mannose-6-phosphate isomerase-like protein (cupin superfamily)
MLKTTVVLLSTAILALAGGCSKSDSFDPAAMGADMGRQPWVVDIEALTVENENFRAAKWTGKHLQMTVMSLKPGEEIGLEQHNKNDQFLRIEQGQGRVLMGKSADNLSFNETVEDDWVVLIPAGYWHNVINTGTVDLKLYSIYSPGEHPANTVHATIEEAEADHHHH